MLIRDIIGTDGEWSDLQDLIGAEVAAVDARATDSALLLAFGTGVELVIPPPWQYSSCLLALASAEFNQDSENRENLSSLVGLCGAKLTAVEADKNDLDLVLDSIRISTTKQHE